MMMITCATNIRLQTKALVSRGNADNSEDDIVILSLILHNDKLHKEID